MSVHQGSGSPRCSMPCSPDCNSGSAKLMTVYTKDDIPQPKSCYYRSNSAGLLPIRPGIRTLGLLEIDDEQGLDIYFPEMRPYIPECKFAACTHQHEPACAVKQAVEAGAIHPIRYESYLRISGFKEGRYERNSGKKRTDRNTRRRKR